MGIHARARREVLASELMTLSEIADLFRVSQQTVWRWVRAGRYAEADISRTLGGHLRIRRSAVEAPLRSRRVAS